MKNWTYICCISLAALVPAGCRRAEEPDPAPPAVSRPAPRVEKAAPAVLPPVEDEMFAPEPVPVEAVNVEPVRVAADALPFRVCALFSGGGRGVRAGVAAREGGATVILSAGDRFLGYLVEDIDYDGDAITVRRDGRLLLVELSGAGDIVERTTGSGLDLMKIKGPLFEATPEEVAAGIDPNNERTWPENYRGPGIERLVRASEGDDYRLGEEETPINGDEDPRALGIETEPPEREIETESDAFPDAAPPAFVPTESERERGIDPNNPDTWPEGYMGPGIERAMQEPAAP